MVKHSDEDNRESIPIIGEATSDNLHDAIQELLIQDTAREVINAVSDALDPFRETLSREEINRKGNQLGEKFINQCAKEYRQRLIKVYNSAIEQIRKHIANRQSKEN